MPTLASQHVVAIAHLLNPTQFLRHMQKDYTHSLDAQTPHLRSVSEADDWRDATGWRRLGPGPEGRRSACPAVLPSSPASTS